MKKIISFIMAVVMAVSVVACGQENTQIEIPKTEIIHSNDILSAKKLEIPSKLQGYENVYLKNFDGQYAIFTIDADTKLVNETVRIIVYDVLNDSITQVVSPSLSGGQVNSVAKMGDKLYFNVWYRDSMKEELYVNDGFLNTLIQDFTLSTTADFSQLKIFGDKLCYIKNKGTFDNYDYEFYEVTDDKLVSVYNLQQQYNSLIEVEDYKDGVFTITEYDLKDEENLYVNILKGDEKETILTLKHEHGHSLAKLENMFIHPVDNVDNMNDYKWMAVTDLNTKEITPVAMMQGGFYDTYRNRGLMYLYGESTEQLLMFEENGNTLKVSLVDIDVKGKNRHSYFMTENNALLLVGTLSQQEFELYLLEY